MFEHYSESARRAVFFARYEASSYGNPFIGPAHLLLGILREEKDTFAKWFPRHMNVEELRAEIEKLIKRDEPISTTIEIPLTKESKKVLKLATDAADKFGHAPIDTVHMFIGILRVEESLAALILNEWGVKLEQIEAQIANTTARKDPIGPFTTPRTTLDSFLAGFTTLTSEALISYFADNAEWIDAAGKRWSLHEIEKSPESLFAYYAKKNATYIVEATRAESSQLFIGSVLWKNALLASEQRAWMHRMSVVLTRGEGFAWQIIFVQVTPVQALTLSLNKADK
jgi:hypothetical protein